MIVGCARIRKACRDHLATGAVHATTALKCG